MIELPISSCEVNNQLGILRHSWLENQILNGSPNYTTKLYTEISSARNAFEGRINPSGEFDEYIRLLRNLLPLISETYSPKQILREGPLRCLSHNIFIYIEEFLELFYVTEFDLQALLFRIEDALEGLDSALIRLRETWYQNDADLDLIRESYVNVQNAGFVLHQALKQLPKGIVLP